MSPADPNLPAPGGARPGRSAAEAYQEQRARFVRAMRQLEAGLTRLDAAQKLEPRDWGFAGSMGHAAETIEALAAGFTRVG